MAQLGDGLNGYLDVQDATLRAPRLEAVSNIGIANTAPQHAFSVGSNLYVSTESSNVLTVDGNVVCEGVKVGLIEIVPSYDFAAVSNVGNVTQSTIQFSNATTGFVTTANIEVGTANLFVDTLTGRVGIGKTDPTVALDVVGNVAVDTNTLFVDSVNNKVGIGVTEPGATLEVTGNVYASSNLEVGTANLFVDTVNSRVGIGTSFPGARFEAVMGTTDAPLTAETTVMSVKAHIGGSTSNHTGVFLFKQKPESSPQTWSNWSGRLEYYTDLTAQGYMEFNPPGSDRGIAFGNTDGGGEIMRLLGTGNVGIGISNPVAKLDILASSSNPSVPTVHIGDNAVDHGGSYGMVNLVRNPSEAGTKAHLAFIRNGNTIFGQGFYNNTNTFGFWSGFGSVANTPTMCFDTSGQIGIGRVPGFPLDIQINSQNTGINMRYGASGPYMIIVPDTTAGAYNNMTRDGDMGIFFSTDSTTVTNEDRGFLIAPHANFPAVLGLKVQENGRVGINIASPTRELDVNGNIKMNNALYGPDQSYLYFDPNNEPKLYSAASTQFLFATNGYAYAAGGWIGPSDRRLKKNIEPLNNALDTLKKLNPVHYEKRSTETMVCDEECKEEKCYHHEDGFIAQEVQEIPELAHAVSHPESTDMLGLNYNSILAYCVKAVQEQQTIIETEKAKVADLLARVTALENTETSTTETSNVTTETSNVTTETSNVTTETSNVA